MLAQDIAALMGLIPHEEEKRIENNGTSFIQGGAFQGYNSPFGVGTLEGIDMGRGEEEWVVSKDRYKWDSIFEVCVST